MMFALILAMSIQATLLDWSSSRPPNGWTLLTVANDKRSISFVRPGPTPRLGWTREEYRVPTGTDGYLSTAALAEYDCDGGRARYIQISTFTGPDLTREPINFSGLSDWNYPRPGSIGGSVFDHFCGR